MCVVQVFAHGALSLMYHENGLECQESGLGQHRLQLLSFVIREHEEFVERNVLRQSLEERGRAEVCPQCVQDTYTHTDTCETCLVCLTPPPMPIAATRLCY